MNSTDLSIGHGKLAGAGRIEGVFHRSVLESLRVIIYDHLALFLQVLDNSPAQRAGLETYFDFVVSIDGIRLVCHIPLTSSLSLSHTLTHMHTPTLLSHTHAHSLCEYKIAITHVVIMCISHLNTWMWKLM